MKERERDDEKSKHSMDVILWRSPNTVFLLYIVDDSAKNALQHVQNEDGNSPPLDKLTGQIINHDAQQMLFLKPNLVVIVEVHSPGLADCGDAKHDANENSWPGCGRLKFPDQEITGVLTNEEL